MTARADGGPAFPTLAVAGGVGLSEGGLTLRDYFAAKAMQSLIMGVAFSEKHGSGRPIALCDERVAERAYQLVDAMLAARGAE